MTTGGEGGMLTTNDTELWQRAWSYKDHGKSYDAVYNRDAAARFVKSSIEVIALIKTDKRVFAAAMAKWWSMAQWMKYSMPPNIPIPRCCGTR